ncbi:MAG: iron ABC transporter permease [Deltaproteobacteria bacterium]|nr:MAG: iron ABC transporter permease [Deltaproteobacteria bacterium]
MAMSSLRWEASTRPPLMSGGRIVVISLVVILAYQVLVPLLLIIWTSLKTIRPGEPGFLDLRFTLANYARAYGISEFWEASLNTLYFAFLSSVYAFFGGTFLAWTVERTNMPLARLIGMITLGRIIIPGVIITISWILTASPSIGVLNHIINALTGVPRFLNIYSFWGMVWVQSLEMTPLAYLLMSAAMKSIDPRLEEASAIAGAGTWPTFRRVTLPLILPAAAAAALLLIIQTVESFEVPLLLGGRARVAVYTTQVYFNTSRTPTDWGLSSTYSIVLLFLSMALLYVYFQLVRHGERYQTITGKDYRPRRIDLGGWKYLTCALSLVLVFFITGLPFLTMLYASLLPRFRPPTAEVLETLTLINYKTLFSEGSYALKPLWNSTLLGVSSASIVMLLVAAISYFVHKTRLGGRKILDFLAFAPIALPSVVLGSAFLWLYLLVPLPIIGTLSIIGLAYLTRYLPFALRFVSTSMVQIHTELEEAAAVAGGGWWRNFYHIYLPLLRPGLMAGWFWVMVHAYRELTISLMLARSSNRTASVIIFDLWSNGSFQQLSAFGVLMFTILIILVSIAQNVSARYGIQERL